MDDCRSHFPVLEKWVFFNHAAVAPLSREATEKLSEWSEDIARNGDLHEGDWIREIEGRRLSAARLIHAKPTEVAFLKNTSEGISAVAEGFPWRDGDNVVIPEGEYPANVYPWLHLASRGVEVRRVPNRGYRVDASDLESAMDARTRLLSVSWVQFSSGYRSDLARLGELCHRRKVDFCVDAIQGLGVFDLDVEAMRIDYMAADGHKWLVSPEGAAIFYIRSSKLDKIRATSVGWKSVVGDINFSVIDYKLKPSAARFEEGSFPMPGVLAFGANIDWFLSIGVDHINHQLRGVSDYLVDRIKSLGMEVVSPRGEGEWSGIVSFKHPRGELDSVVRTCREHGVILNTRAGRLRASPHFYNNEADVDRLMNVLAEIRG